MTTKTIYGILLALSVSGCATSEPQLIKKEFVLPPIPVTNECKLVKLPSGTPTNRDISNLLIAYNTMNKKCVNEINTLKKYLEDAKVILESKGK